MNKLHTLAALVLSVLLVSACATGGAKGGGTVQVNFQSPEKFTDMSRKYMDQRGADEGYLSELRDYIQRIGSGRVPAGYTLAVTITDVDMAGDFEPQRGPQFSDVRIVKSIYPPRINLTYRLTDSTGAVRSEGERQLRDQTFEWNVSPINRDDPLRYEKALLDNFLSDVARQAR
jgi:hypothetical protein